MLLIAVSLIAIIFCLLYLYLTWNYGYWKKRGARGPAPKLFAGNFPKVILNKRIMLDDLIDIYNEYKNKERFVGIYFSRTPQVMILDPKLAREILITKFTNFHDNESSKWPKSSVEKISVRNPFFSVGSEWKERRSEVIAGLSMSKLKSAYLIMQESCKKLIEYLLQFEASNTEAEAKNFSYKYACEVVSDFLWGIDAGAFSQKNRGKCVIEQMAKDMVLYSFNSVASFYTQMPIFLRFHSRRLFPNFSDNFFTKLQNDAIELRMKNKLDRPDFLNYLLQLQERKHISTTDMVGHSVTVVLDGFETSSSVLSHSLLFLAKNPNAQSRLRDEILASLQPDGSLTFEDLMELPFLDNVINETLRFLTPVPILSKMCTKPTEFENNDGTRVKIDVGTVVHIPIHCIHHDSDYFTNPTEFLPERFDGGLIKKYKDSGDFVPFGDGPRICAGMRLAQLEIKSALVEVLKTFEISIGKETEENSKLGNIFVLELQGDFNLKLKKL